MGCLVPEFLVRNNGAKIFGDGVWFKNNAAALTDEGANILGFGFGFGNNLPCESRGWPVWLAKRLLAGLCCCRVRTAVNSRALLVCQEN